LLRSEDASFAEYYTLKTAGTERLAGQDADVAQLLPKDQLRFGYRIWSEKKTGLMLQLQTLAADGRLLEQSAFSEINLDAAVSMEKLAAMMARTEGYKVERPELIATTAQAHGWSLRKPVPGFRPMGCYQRVGAATGAEPGRGMVQWIFSDGLATVSLFLEPFNPSRHTNEAEFDVGGATRTLTRRVQDSWLTAVGEVPFAALIAFAQVLERKK
jgi:sigma-E factor negative regulatory protein RseB